MLISLQWQLVPTEVLLNSHLRPPNFTLVRIFPNKYILKKKLAMTTCRSLILARHSFSLIQDSVLRSGSQKLSSDSCWPFLILSRLSRPRVWARHYLKHDDLQINPFYWDLQSQKLQAVGLTARHLTVIIYVHLLLVWMDRVWLFLTF